MKSNSITWLRLRFLMKNLWSGIPGPNSREPYPVLTISNVLGGSPLNSRVPALDSVDIILILTGVASSICRWFHVCLSDFDLMNSNCQFMSIYVNLCQFMSISLNSSNMGWVKAAKRFSPIVPIIVGSDPLFDFGWWFARNIHFETIYIYILYIIIILYIYIMNYIYMGSWC